MSDNSTLVVPMFRVHSQRNEHKSSLAGRPIYDDIEVVEIHFAANRQTVGVFPAHEVWRHEPDPQTGEPTPVTYAMRWPDQYQKFKAGAAQTMAGTPLEELPFLTQAKRYELKALNIYTAEQLASIGGPNLKNLGLDGQELQIKAKAYLDNANGSANVTKLASENARLQAQIDALQADMRLVLSAKNEASEPAGTAALADDELKAIIKERTGTAPRGNPSHSTLVRMVDELEASEAA